MPRGRGAGALAALVALLVLSPAGGAQAALPPHPYTIVPKPLSFGHVIVGDERTAGFWVTNTSDSATLGFSGDGVTPANSTQAFSEYDNPFYSQPCSVMTPFGPGIRALAPGDSCFLYYLFAPTAPSGGKNGTARIAVYDVTGTVDPGAVAPAPSTPSGTTTAALKGSADPLAFTVDPNPVSFGHHTVGGGPVTAQVQVTNNSPINVAYAGGGIAPATSPFSEVPGGAPACFDRGDGNTTAIVQGPGDTCSMTFSVTRPKTGTRTASAKILAYGATDAFPGTAVDVTHARVATSTSVQLKIVVDPVKWRIGPLPRHQTLNLGTVSTDGGVAQASIDVTNLSDIPLQFDSGGVTPATTRFFAVSIPGTCWGVDPFVGSHGMVVPPGGSCPMNYSFSPTKTGAQTATATVDVHHTPYSDGDAPIDGAVVAHNTLTLKGTGQ